MSTRSMLQKSSCVVAAVVGLWRKRWVRAEKTWEGWMAPAGFFFRMAAMVVL